MNTPDGISQHEQFNTESQDAYSEGRHEGQQQEYNRWLSAVDEMSRQVDNTYPKGNAFGAVPRSFISELKTRMEAKI